MTAAPATGLSAGARSTTPQDLRDEEGGSPPREVGRVENPTGFKAHTKADESRRYASCARFAPSAVEVWCRGRDFFSEIGMLLRASIRVQRVCSRADSSHHSCCFVGHVAHHGGLSAAQNLA